MMIMPYVCEGTLIKTLNGREGKVISVDRKTKLVVVNVGKTFFTDELKNIKVVSYKEVK